MLVDLARLLADGGKRISDVGVLRDQGELFGPVAGRPDVWRALNELDSPAPAGASRRAEAALQATSPLHNGGG